MPIDPIHLQRRHAEQGRIRLGQKVGEKGRPSKLEQFRFTSPNRGLIEALAELYGGTAEPWDNAGIPEFQVLSTSTSIPIIVVKNGVSQWFEHWTAAGIGHRCDGTRNSDGVLCDPEDRAHIEATKKPTTRLSVMLPELDSTGVWRMETHGWNAAAEIPMVGELAAHVGAMVPARLLLVERRKVIQVNGKPTTSRFVVPMVDLEINVRDLAQIVSGGPAPQQLEAPARQEIAPAPAEAGPLAIWQDQIDKCSTVEEVNTLWREIVAAGQLYPDVKAALTRHGAALKAAEEPATPPSREEPPSVTPDPAEGETVVAEIVEEDPPADADTLTDPIEDDRAWQDLMSAMGRKGLATSEIIAGYTAWAGHPVDQGNATSYRAFVAAQ